MHLTVFLVLVLIECSICPYSCLINYFMSNNWGRACQFKAYPICGSAANMLDFIIGNVVPGSRVNPSM